MKNMWHEARRQERKIRGMLVDYRKRAERRRDFYEKIKADPTQFLQVHGRRCKIHLDPNVAAAAGGTVMMPWQGQSDTLIDRFDVRAHLDYIAPFKMEDESELTHEERQLNYERYRIIAQNSFLGISEEKFLKQLHLEEQFGYTETRGKKDQKSGGAAIAFNYEDATGMSQPIQFEPVIESDDESLDSDLDVDLAINISKMEPAQAHDMNKHGRQFGMSSNDFYSFLTNDLEEAESYRLAKEEEQEKALFAGRKSRRERRYHREKRLANRVISPPSYMAQSSPVLSNLHDPKSLSRSPSPENSGKITYITSFGDEEEPQTSSKPTYAEKLKHGKGKIIKECSSERIVFVNRYKSRSTSRDRDRYKRGRKTRSRSGNRLDKLGRRRNSSQSRHSRSRSRSSYKPRKRSYSRSKVRSSRSRSRNRGRSSCSRSQRRTRSRSFSRRSLSRTMIINNKSTNRRSRSISAECSSLKPKPQTTSSEKRHSNSSISSSSSASEKNQSCLKSLEKIEKKKSPTPPESNTGNEQYAILAANEDSTNSTALPRYYGRRKGNESSSELSGSEDDNKQIIPIQGINLISLDLKKGSGNKTGTTIKKSSVPLTITEKLKRKRQAQLNRQYKADKIAEQLKTEREKQEQQSREDELREMVIKFRRRQREKRHAYDSDSASSYSDSDASEKSKTSNLGVKSSSRGVSPQSPRHKPEKDMMKEAKPSRSDRENDRDSRDRRSYRVQGRDRRWDHRSPSPSRQGHHTKGSKSLVDY